MLIWPLGDVWLSIDCGTSSLGRTEIKGLLRIILVRDSQNVDSVDSSLHGQPLPSWYIFHGTFKFFLGKK